VDDGALLITDTRPCAPASSHVLTGSEAQVLLACDHYQSFTALARQFRPALDEIKLRDLLASLESQALLVSQNNNYVALPIFRWRQEASGKKCHVDAEI
jgi:hypothetical protein